VSDGAFSHRPGWPPPGAVEPVVRTGAGAGPGTHRSTGVKRAVRPGRRAGRLPARTRQL